MPMMVRDDDVFVSRSRIDAELSRCEMGLARRDRPRTNDLAARAGTCARLIVERRTDGTLDALPTRPYPHAYLSANQTRPGRARVTPMKDGAP